MALTTTNGMSVDGLDAAPNGPGLAQQLGNQVDEFYGKSVANAAALPVSGKYAGQRVWLIDVKSHAVWTGTGWDYDIRPGTTGITYGSGFTTIAEGSKVGRVEGMVTLHIAAQKATIGSSDQIISLSAPFRPAAGETYRISGSFNASPRYATITSTGAVVIDAATTGGIVATITYPYARP